MYKKIFSRMCFLSMLILVLTSLIVLSATYTLYTNKLEKELYIEAKTVYDFLNTSDSPVTAIKNISFTADRDIILANSNGKILYAGGSSGISSEEISEILNSTEIYSKKLSVSSGKKFSYFARSLDNGMIFKMSVSSDIVYSFFFSVLAAVVVLGVLIYIFTLMIAAQLTKNITQPIENFSSFDNENIEDVYDEIKPFVARIIRQNKEIQRQMEKIRKQKFRLEAITDNINEGLIILDNHKKILSLNSYSVQLFNVTEYGYKYKSFDSITDSDLLKSAVSKALTGTKNDITITLNSGVHQAFCSPVYDNDEISGVIVLLFDITERAQTEMIRKEFTANVSHELKTPLTSIHGYAQIIAGQIAKPEDITRFAYKIEKESSRLIVLIDDIIKLSKLDENADTYEKQTISLRKIIDDIRESLSGKADEKNIEFTIQGYDCIIFANPSQITEMIYNLCDNAIKYNKPNGSINITLSDKQFTISDTGIGIPENLLDRIYERFFRVDKSHSKIVNGTGLGLSIVKHIAQSINAEIHVKSKLNIGTSFTVIFKE